MFSGSILENIEIDKTIDKHKLNQIAIDCDIKDDIDRFEKGYDTLIGEKGTKLSGGQKQRICLARSLVSNKPILILDDALNKLDNKTKSNILSKLKNKYKDRIIIFISNDLEIIKYVSSIIYINQATTLKGTHNELIAKNESYRNLTKIRKGIIKD